jgi:hypothetical protein
MPTDKRRAAARRRAWGRGPIILRFEPLEDRQLLTATTPALPDLVGQSFQTPSSLNWGSTFQASGVVANIGDAPVTQPFQVDIYASPTSMVSSNSVYLGQATIPAGLQPGATSSFNEQLTLPTAAPSALDASGAFYIAMVIDPQNQIAESNKTNNADVGAGYDYELVTPAATPSAALVGTSLSLPSNAPQQWGGTFQLSQTITNTGNANAPATRALVVLTPPGDTPGGSSDVTIGSVSVPAIPAGQSVTITPTITLPQAPPASLAGNTQFTLSMVQDADYLTNQMYPHTATQGLGLDQTTISVSPPIAGSPTAAAGPDLSVSDVAVSSQNIKWGQNFEVAATLSNGGGVAEGPVRVRFLLVGTSGSTSNSLFLGDTIVNSLPASGSQTIETILKLPATLPNGATLNSSAVGEVAVVVDPENALGDPNLSNNIATSPTIQLQKAGATSVSTPATTTTTTAQTTTVTSTAVKASSTTAAKTTAAATKKPAAAAKPKPAPKPAKHTLSHNLKVVPREVEDFLKRSFGIK